MKTLYFDSGFKSCAAKAWFFFQKTCRLSKEENMGKPMRQENANCKQRRRGLSFDSGSSTNFFPPWNLLMASPSDLSTGEAALRKQNRGSPIKFLIPLLYAPVLPLIRIAFRRNPVLRDRLFYGTLAGAFAHGFYLVTDLYDIESK